VSLGTEADKSNLGLYSTSNKITTPPAAQPSSVSVNNGVVTTNGGKITVNIDASDSGYDNKIYYSTDGFKTKHLIGVDSHVASLDLGQFQAGTKIEFGIDNGQGGFFRSGGADKNADGVNHVQTKTNSDGSAQFGFEDLRGGGDRDYNDAIITVRETPTAPSTSSGPSTNAAAAPAKSATPTRQAVSGSAKAEAAKAEAAKTQSVSQAAKPNPAASTPTPAKAPIISPVVPPQPRAEPTTPAKSQPIPAVVPPVTSRPVPSTNRSGLADGTNPGQGAQHTSSANPGTLNPNQANSKPSSSTPAKSAGTETHATSTTATTNAAEKAKASAAISSYQKVAGM
jgi:hypothetical protein